MLSQVMEEYLCGLVPSGSIFQLVQCQVAMVNIGHIFLVKMLFIYTPSKYPGAEQTTSALFFFAIAINISLCCVVLSKKTAESFTQCYSSHFCLGRYSPTNLRHNLCLKKKVN